MSRTYHHGSKAKERLFGLQFWPTRTRVELKDDGRIIAVYQWAPAPPKKRRTKDHWHWMATPMWWIREMHQVPYRRKVRDAITRAIKGDLDVEFPGYKKPHTYYW